MLLLNQSIVKKPIISQSPFATIASLLLTSGNENAVSQPRSEIVVDCFGFVDVFAV